MSKRDLQLSEIDLKECDKEPIHIPNCIQPHGALIVLKEPELTMIQLSDNVELLLGYPVEDLLNRPLEKLLASEQIKQLVLNMQDERLTGNPLYISTLKIKGQDQVFDGLIHHIDHTLILELEPVQRNSMLQQPSMDIYKTIGAVLSTIEHTSTLDSLYQIVAEEMRAISGFDRVMVYRFEEDEHGVVIAEAKRDDLQSFLGLHYPASDIPVQARRLYTSNYLRLIPTIHYIPAYLVPSLCPVTGRMLDMSHSVLRSVSTLHREYLKNMHVVASMSISIIKEHKLWGLIACHHQTPRYILYEIRAACELLNRVMSIQMSIIEGQIHANQIVRYHDMQTKLVEFISMENKLSDGLTRHNPNVLDLFDASGVAVCSDGECRLLGQTPSENQIVRIIDWLTTSTDEDVFSTRSFSRIFPEARQWKEKASGLLALTISKSRRDYILWFRPEIIYTVNWGGDPDKSVTVSKGGGKLSPRTSFDIWKQAVRETSVPWNSTEIEAAWSLRSVIIRVVLSKLEELARLNAELERSNIELEKFAYIASHDLKEPLRGIHNYARFLIEDYSEQLDEEGVYKLNTLVRLSQRMEALINSQLYYSQVNRAELAFNKTDLNELLQHVIEMLHISIQESGVQVRIPRPLPIVKCDSIRIGEVFTNLISNAIKYNDKKEKWIEIGYLNPQEQKRAQPEVSQPGKMHIFFVQDNGIGIPHNYFDSIFIIFKRLHKRDEYGGGIGAGLSIAKKIIERHAGKIWVESVEGEGTTFYFTLGSEAE